MRQTGNNSALLLDINAATPCGILNNIHFARTTICMKQITLALTCLIALGLTAPAHAADCFADYKAKQDDPLRLHYGVAQISGPCDASAARSELAARLAAQGWTLLNIVSVFGPEGLAQRKDSAGSNYLRF